MCFLSVVLLAMMFSILIGIGNIVIKLLYFGFEHHQILDLCIFHCSKLTYLNLDEVKYQNVIDVPTTLGYSKAIL